MENGRLFSICLHTLELMCCNGIIFTKLTSATLVLVSQMSQVSQVSQIGNMAAQFKTGSTSVCQLVQSRGKHSCSTNSILHCRVLGSTMRAAFHTGNKEHCRRQMPRHRFAIMTGSARHILPCGTTCLGRLHQNIL